MTLLLLALLPIALVAAQLSTGPVSATCNQTNPGAAEGTLTANGGQASLKGFSLNDDGLLVFSQCSNETLAVNFAPCFLNWGGFPTDGSGPVEGRLVLQSNTSQCLTAVIPDDGSPPYPITPKTCFANENSEAIRYNFLKFSNGSIFYAGNAMADNSTQNPSCAGGLFGYVGSVDTPQEGLVELTCGGGGFVVNNDTATVTASSARCTSAVTTLPSSTSSSASSVTSSDTSTSPGSTSGMAPPPGNAARSIRSYGLEHSLLAVLLIGISGL